MCSINEALEPSAEAQQKVQERFMIKNVKGTRDFLPGSLDLWHKVEDVARRVPALFGYQEIRTPIFEYTDLFKRGVGEGTDVVGKEMYVFDDKGGDSLTLRPELTAPVARAIQQENLLRAFPTLRLWYYGACFRYEQPQAGRYRQFQQLGAECIGSPNPESDAEIIMLGYSIFKELGVTDYTLNLNSLANLHCRTIYKKELLDYLTKHEADLSESSKKRMQTNPLRTLDSKDERDKEIVKNAPRILSYLDEESQRHFDAVQSILKACNVPYVINDTLVRGLDYYSHTVFEFTTKSLGTQDALGGGGRYDNLFEQIGGKATPGVGFGLGVDRIVLMLEKLEQSANKLESIWLISNEFSRELGAAVATTLRNRGYNVVTDVQRRSFKNQLTSASKAGASWALILGEDEVNSHSITIKNLNTSEQNSILLSEVQTYEF